MGRPVPGRHEFLPRLFIAHVFLLPALIAALIGLHLATIVRQHHSQFPGPAAREDNVVGSPTVAGLRVALARPAGAAPRCSSLLGGLMQINPIWQWGPYEPWLGDNGAQPDWYLGLAHRRVAADARVRS